ncbi:MAG TPA: hypothetical protein VEK12_08450 [Alphaproteobacteria bacterium]|nr:hypothetical protein [Alphaproteobacteria bacterium]
MLDALFQPMTALTRLVPNPVNAATALSARTPNRGWPIAAIAGALGLRLAGPRRDVERALYLFALASVIDAALVVLLGFLEQAIRGRSSPRLAARHPGRDAYEARTD